MRPKIVVVGSSNTDLVVKLPRLPRPGETIIGGTFSMAPGGKGANQAVAAARAGGDVLFISKVGDDHFGTQALEGFMNDGLDARFVGRVPKTASGIGLIFVDDRGENCIGVASGANDQLLPDDIERARDAIASADVLLLQLEIPLPTVEAAIRIASRSNLLVILNPAPALQLEPGLFKHLSVITPNEHEAQFLTGVHLSDDASIIHAAQSLRSRGVHDVVITLGPRGAMFATGETNEFVPGFDIDAVDSTAAGDIFNGALAVSLSEGQPIREAVRFANAAAALSVSRLGAQPSAPSRIEINEMMKRHSTATPLKA